MFEPKKYKNSKDLFIIEKKNISRLEKINLNNFKKNRRSKSFITEDKKDIKFGVTETS